MTLFQPFSHYLSYGATDQQTLRDLAGRFSGLVVPGTIAAYQQRGTGGFVLSLSATQAAAPYVIDSRFPLFQQRLIAPKRSHYALADLFGYPDLIERRTAPRPGDFATEPLLDMAQRWVEFNDAYHSAQGAAFEKYARRLEEPIPQPENIQRPERILAPYFMCDGRDDDWWQHSKTFWEATREAASERAARVVAAKSVNALSDLIDDTSEDELVIWVSGLDEVAAGYRELRTYAIALERAAQRGVRLFALYGGFYHVLMRRFGLSGLSHGIGFGEYRVWEELPQSGPPPARYYLRRAHRYVPQDLANALALRDPSLTACPCPDCEGRRPLELDYHALMRHSVAARAEEIEMWAPVRRANIAKLLRDELAALDQAIRRPTMPGPLQRAALPYVEHLDTWANALDSPPA
ncbi:MAG: hypothetical protein JO168_07025 [Solirubrobacterales bacterium]|nr:hypothetical protein [Solirubrobacterales bacterium]